MSFLNFATGLLISVWNSFLLFTVGTYLLNRAVSTMFNNAWDIIALLTFFILIFVIKPVYKYTSYKEVSKSKYINWSNIMSSSLTSIIIFIIICLTFTYHLFQAAYTIHRATQYIENENYEDAISEYNEMVDLLPFDYSVYVLRASAYEVNKDYSNSLRDYETALDLLQYHETLFFFRNFDEEKSYLHAYRASSLYFLKRYDEAIAGFTMAIDFNNEYAEAYKSRANAYFAKGIYYLALADYQKYYLLTKDESVLDVISELEDLSKDNIAGRGNPAFFIELVPS